MTEEHAMSEKDFEAIKHVFAGKYEMYLAAINECLDVADRTIRSFGKTWTADGVAWFHEVVAPGFKKAIVDGNAQWKDDERENALRRLDLMCRLAVLQAEGGMVTRTASDRAFRRLQCDRNDGPEAKVVFCE